VKEPQRTIFFPTKLFIGIGVSLLLILLPLRCVLPLEGQQVTLDAQMGSEALARRRIPLSRALRTVSIEVQKGYVSYGAEIYLAGGREPIVNLALQPDSTAQAVLSEIFKQLPEYRFRILSDHFVSIYPNAAISDPNDPLNLKIERFDVSGEKAGLILTWPERFIPKLKARLTPPSDRVGREKHIDLYVGPVAGGPDITLHLENVTVREILNAVSEFTQRAGLTGTPLGWLYAFDPASTPNVGNVQYWRCLISLPHNRTEQLRNDKNR
jgi:hypothetical protein